jgi:hypothetical protein
MREDLITLRVAARFQREVVATFISDKWFKAKKAELVAALKTPVQAHRTEMWAYDLDTKVGDFLTRFEDEFKSMVTYEPALESVQRRVKDAKNSLKSIVDSLELVVVYMNHPDFKDPVQYLRWYASTEIHDRIAEVTKVLGGFLKWGWVINDSVIDRLVQQTLKRATPEQLESLTSEYSGRIDTVRYEFLARIGFKEASLKALKRTKLDKFDPIKWLDWMYESLKSNYTEQAVGDQGAYREFDMYGLKVVIKDDTVIASDIKEYVKYIDEAYAKMKIKGFAKAWYGTFYIECLKCGGVNYNTGGGVAGHYVIGPDTVSCFERPSHYVVDTLVHELGHRYWYKQMTPAQRGKFESLVKVRPTARRPAESDIPTFLVSEEKAKAAHEKIDNVAEPLRRNLELFRKSKLRWFTKIIDAFFQPIADSVWNFGQELNSAVHSSGADSSVNQTVRKALLDTIEFSSELGKLCRQMDDTLISVMNTYPDGTDFNQAFRIERGKWLDKTLDLLNRTVAAAHHYVTIAVEATNEYESSKGKQVVEDWDRRFREDTRPVAPVSDYGGSNISEAFAEAFTHYVLEMDMNRDQVESFRSVFSSLIDPLIALVAQRYLQEAIS